MDFEFTSEQRMWSDMLDRFMDQEVGREYTRAHDASREFPDEAYRKVAQQGWLGLLLPEDVGGAAIDPIMYAIFCEKIAKFSLDFAACFITSMFTVTNIAGHGSRAQKERYIPPFLTGEQKFSISISEPGSGSDAAGLITRAKLVGDDWVINGSKMWCSGAHQPNTLIVLMCRTSEEKHGGISMLLVPNTTPGLQIQKLNTLVRRSLGTTALFFDEARVPRENLLGETGKGWRYIGEHLALERLGLAATYVGNATTALADTMKYTKERVQFGQPIASFQVMKHRMAEDATALEAARLMVYSAATKLARGERAIKEVSMAKVFAAQTAFRIATNGMQALGGYSQLPEFDMERYFREAKHGMVGGGTNEIQYGIIAKELGL
jgi:alkylation response protein AidB-like acyl-CoA dehydrogenase